MNKRRLLKLADLLTADAKNRKGVKFNLYIVGSSEKADEGKVAIDCGTEACAMGLAAISGAFKRAGLGYRVRNFGIGEYSIQITVNGRRRGYDDAATKIFGLTLSQANFLFTPGNYPLGMSLEGAKGERYVAKRIRDFVAGKVEA